MAAANFLDAIARMPGCAGSHRDGTQAYTQVELKDAPRLLGLPKYQVPDTYVTIPADRRPKPEDGKLYELWQSIPDPVVLLERNVYGHPLGGLLWDRFLEENLMATGWEKIPGWECLYVHRRYKVWLSAYVDDFKMAGQATSIPKAWKELDEAIDN